MRPGSAFLSIRLAASSASTSSVQPRPQGRNPPCAPPSETTHQRTLENYQRSNPLLTSLNRLSSQDQLLVLVVGRDGRDLLEVSHDLILRRDRNVEGLTLLRLSLLRGFV